MPLSQLLYTSTVREGLTSREIAGILDEARDLLLRLAARAGERADVGCGRP